MNGKKVYIGMSGGVDSSVSAALLKEAGADVTGVFIKVWQPDWMECTWREDRLDAMRVAAYLEIPFITLDLEQEYKKEVVDHMIAEYKSGRTPNPDIMCNSRVKFGAFFEWALSQGADFVATGHYARIEKDDASGGAFRLFSGVDLGKDQSYFLYALTQRELSRTIFPVGGMEKSETRRLARKFGLPVAEKRDSQGLCFIGKVDMKEFLSHYIPRKKGKALDEQGNAVGEHDGAVFLTIGERHGFSLSEKTPNDEPRYVVGRNIRKNTVTVSRKDPNGSLSSERKEYALKGASWTLKEPIAGRRYAARIRHLGELVPCVVDASDARAARIAFERPIAAAEGQSAVIYDGEECLGGGTIAQI